MSCRSLRNDAIADDSAAEDGTSQSAAGTDHAAGFAAGFAVTLRHTPTCAEHLRATEGEPIGGDDEWCTAEQISAYFGEMSSHVSPGGIPYRVVDHAGGARILVGDYELYFNGGPGVYELERQLVDPSNPAGVSQPYVEFVNRVIDSLFVPTRHLDGAPTRAAWRRSAQTESRIPGRSPGFPDGVQDSRLGAIARRRPGIAEWLEPRSHASTRADVPTSGRYGPRSHDLHGVNVALFQLS